MTAAVHPAASQHLPGFITAPGETDVLMGVSTIMLLLIVLGIGVFYFKLHAIPEQIAHKSQRIQFQIVAALSLLALFTHNHTYWVIALLLALVPLPDFSTPITGIAESLARIANAKSPRRKTHVLPAESESPDPDVKTENSAEPERAGNA